MSGNKKLSVIILFLIVFALPLLVFLIKQQTQTQSNAAAADKLEAEEGVLGGNAKIQTDSLASGGSYIELGLNQNSQITGIYGPGINIDSKNNNIIGGINNAKLSHKFKASTNSNLNYIIWALRVNDSGSTGYAKGDNGAYKISIQTDDGSTNHLPSGTKLTETTGAPGPGNFGGTNRKTVFSTSPLLQKDQIYHVVWENTSSDPANNYFSVNEIWTYDKLIPRQPILSDSDYACLYNSGSGWQIQSNNTADMDLGYADGTHDGVSYLQAFYDSGQEIVARISGNRIAREIFTVSGGNKTISKISVRLAHVSGNSNLNLKILDSSGSQIASENISNNLITERNWSNWTGNSNVSNGNWVSVTLQNPITLTNGSTYSLIMSSPSDTTFAAVPIRYKDFSAESDTMLSYAFKDGKAQESLDNGSTWQDVYSYQPQANFQFYLTIASRTSTNTPTPTPINIDAGLTIPTSSFQFPTTPASGGQIRNVISYGATCNDSSNDDSVGIKAAIAASIAGDEVIFPSNCTLHLKTWPIDLKTGVNIKGQDKTTSVLNGMFSSAPNPLFYARTQPSTSTNQPVSNLSITNFSYTTLSGTPPEIFIKLGTGTWNTDNSEWKVVSKIRIENLTIEKFKKYAIDIQNSQFIYVANNVIKNATSLGGGGEGYGIKVDMDKSQNNWIKGNIVGPVIRHAYLVQYDANHNLFDGNSATGTTQDAFDMHGENEFSNEFRNNTVTNCVTTDPYTGANTYGSGFGIGEVPTSTSAPPGDAGAHDFSGDNNWIHNNSVSGCFSGVRVNNTNNTYIENNDITNNRSGGILIGDLDSYVFPEQISNPPAYGTSNVIAKNNTIKNNPVGFKLKNTKNTQILNNITTNNTGSGLTLTAQTTGYTITGNDFRFNGSTVNLGGNTSGTFTNNLQ